MADPKDFLLNTDYEMDKIVLFKEGQLTDEVTLPHNLGYAPLVFGVWSLDSDFSSTNTMSENAGLVLPGVECLGSSTDITVLSVGNTDSRTIYYRVYAFEPAGVQKPADSTSQYAKEFMMNTDYNYAKLKATGTFTQPGQEYAHNLGYIPQVMAWRENEAPYYDIEQFNISSELSEVTLKVTTNKLIYTNNSSTSGIAKIHWRIYYDEA